MKVARELRSARDVLARVAALLDGLDPDRSSLTDTERLELVAVARVVTGRLQGLTAALAGEAERVGAAERVVKIPLASWLATSQRLTRREASRIVGQGRDLTRFPQVTGQALRGQVGFEQATAISRVLTRLPAKLAPEQLARAETILLSHAAEADSHDLAGKTRDVLEAIDPAEADDQEAARLDRELKVATANRHLDFWSDGRGSVLFKGSLPTVEAEPFLKVVDAYAQHQRRTDREQATRNHDHRGAEELTPTMRRADALVAMIAAHQRGNRAPSCGGDRPRVVVTLDYNQLLNACQARGLPGVATTPAPADPPPGTTLCNPGRASSGRTSTQRSDAARREADPTDTGPAGTERNGRGRNGPDVDPTGRNGPDGDAPERDDSVGEVDIHAPSPRLRGALLETATPITAGELRRLACDADILPVVLGGPSEVLDVGRSQRLVTPAIRAALVLRDAECIFPGCHTPPAQCHAHHIVPWWAGGPTALVNLVLLCPHHHGLIEPVHGQPAEERWRVIAGTDQDHRPKVVPPNHEQRTAQSGQHPAQSERPTPARAAELRTANREQPAQREQCPDQRGHPVQPEEAENEQPDHGARATPRPRSERRMLLTG